MWIFTEREGRGIFSMGAEGALSTRNFEKKKLLAPAIFENFSTGGKNCGCWIKILLILNTQNVKILNMPPGRWWDRIQAIFLNLFYFMYKKIKMRISKCFCPIAMCRALQQNWVRLFAMHGLSAIELEPSIILKLKLSCWTTILKDYRPLVA
jgi:hypothetical protein